MTIMIAQCIDELKQLRLMGMANSLAQLSEQPNSYDLNLIEGLKLLVSSEQCYRDEKRLNRLLKQAKLRYQQATLEIVDYQHQRQLNKMQFLELAQCHWIKKYSNLIFLGATGVGKSFLACVLGNQACREGFSVRYYRMSKLLELIRQSQAEGSFTRFLNQLVKTQCLLLDDWGIDQLNRQQRNAILEIIEDRYHKGSTIIGSQLPIEHWHNYIGDNTIADAVLDRILSNSSKIVLEGSSMRKLDLTHNDHKVY